MSKRKKNCCSSRGSQRGSYGPLLAVVGTMAIVGGLIWLAAARSGQAVGDSSGSLSISEKSWSIGTVSMKDGINTKEVELTNESAEPVIVTGLETSCMCTTAHLIHEDGTTGPTKGMVMPGGPSSALSETIAPGEKVKLAVSFDPNAHGPEATGPIDRTVTLETNSLDQPTIKMRFSGTVVK